MGTRGYKVYHYKGLYLVRLNRFDSEPAVFGLEVVLPETPRSGTSKETFEEWVKVTREYLEAKFEQLDSNIEKDEFVTDQIPNYPSYTWIYEIDLDNLVFLVNHVPIFRLDSMPPGKVFVKCISYDHFGHRASHELTPIQFRSNWRSPPPPARPKSLIAYESCPSRSSTSFIHELLDRPMALSSIERARTAFVGPLITRFMIEYRISRYLRELEKVPDRGHISKGMHKLALSFVNFAVGAPNPSLPCNPSSITWDFIWICEDVCLRITTHLDDEQNLQASIGDLVHHINETHTTGTFYGIAYSIFHCAIVRLDKDEQGTSFAHTPALQFLPSFYAREISTPGIEALSRLGCQASGVEFLNAIAEGHHLPRLTHGLSKSVASRVPVKIWKKVGNLFTSPIDLVNLAYISPQALSAAADLARYPWVLQYRLVDAVDSISLIPKTTEETDEDEIRKYYFRLGRARFTAVKGGRHVTVELGQGTYRNTSKTVKVMSYLDYKLDESELYVLELGDGAAEVDGDDDDDDAGPSKRVASLPAATKPEKDDSSLANDSEAERVREWRHRLQKTFFNKTTPKPDEMPACNELFTAIEYYDKMNIHCLTRSKIGKVMRHIHLLPLDKVPRDEEFQFRSRAKELVDKWYVILTETGSGASGTPVGSSSTAPFKADKAEEDAPSGAAAVPAGETHPAADWTTLVDVTMAEA